MGTGIPQDFQVGSLASMGTVHHLVPRSLGAAAHQEESNMLKEAIDRLMSLADPVFREEAGRLYSSRALMEIQPPLIKPIEVQTLAGFRDLYKLHESSDEPAIILIEDHRTVHLVSKQVDEWNRRAGFVKAELPEDTPQFRFATWMDPDEFVIGLMTLFDDSNYAHGDHRKVVKLVSSLAAEAVTISTDDGFSQRVVTRQGLVTKEEEKVSPRVTLSPYRTFREVAQPASDFVLRMKSRQGMTPMCALFQADGGEWKNIALQNIRKYFETLVPGADIVA